MRTTSSRGRRQGRWERLRARIEAPSSRQSARASITDPSPDVNSISSSPRLTSFGSARQPSAGLTRQPSTFAPMHHTTRSPPEELKVAVRPLLAPGTVGVGRGVTVPLGRAVGRDDGCDGGEGLGATSRAGADRVGVGEARPVTDVDGEAVPGAGTGACVAGREAATRLTAPSPPTSRPAESMANQATAATAATADSQMPAAASHRTTRTLTTSARGGDRRLRGTVGALRPGPHRNRPDRDPPRCSTGALIATPVRTVGATGRTVPSVAVILLVEDDSGIRSALSRALTERGHAVHWQPAGLPGLQSVIDDRPDVVLLDLGLPDVDGVQVLTMMRSVSDVPVIVVTARDDDADIVKALDAGADDFVTKPFGADHLEARIRAVLRRSGSPRTEGPITVGELVVDARTRSATLEGRPLELSRKEFDLLLALAQRAGEVVSKRDLLAEVWRQPYGGGDRTVDVHLSWLRRKLGESAAEPRYLHSTRGVGVRLAAPAGA